jgi:protein involved in polysaccharide export with SLBB domain
MTNQRFRFPSRLAAVMAVAGTLFMAEAKPQIAAGSDPVQMFQNLSPEQQRAILDRLGGGAAGAGSAVRSKAAEDSQARQYQTREQRGSQEDEEPLIPLLRADDTIVVDLFLPPDADELRQVPAPAPQPAVQNTPERTTAVEDATKQRRQRLVDNLTTDERRKLEDLVRMIRDRNPYVLDRNAQLNLPGFAPIPLGGLTEEQARQRLSVEPVLLPLDIRVSRLPLIKTGVAGLKPFGYDLFNEPPSSFSPVTDVPVPADYVMGADDQLIVQLFGNQNRTVPLVVNRDGVVAFPELGPIRVGGLTFNAARQLIESRVSQQMIGVRASVSMGETRTIRVFVLGEARQPGSYAISGLATMTTALFVSGGVKPIGSLRDIQLKRQGKLVRQLDLYDLLVRGDTSDDARLLPGDVIFIPPVGPTVSVDGEVKRPAVYELQGASNVTALVEMAGGFTPEADRGRASLVNVDENGRRAVLEVDLRQASGGSRALRNGDVLRVSRLRPQVDSGVTLEGFVYRPGPVAWRDGLRLTDVIGSIDELKPDADQSYILVRREMGPERRVSVVSADLNAALAAPGSAANILLQPRDRILVFDLAPGRERIIRPLLDELRLQSGVGRPTEVVRVEGQVKVPGEYPLETGMRVSDLLRAGGRLGNNAYGGKADLVRYALTDAGAVQTEVIEIDLAALRAGNASANVELRPFDYLVVKEITDWGKQESVTLRGEVRFPGVYPIRKGETLKELIDRAGGLTSLAFAKGAAFTRKDLKEREQKQLDELGEKLQSDLAAMSLQAANANQTGASQALISSQSMLTQLKGSKAVGRMVIDLPGVLAAAPRGTKDVDLRDGDLLVVPRQSQEVTVIGEVHSATSHFYNASLRRDDYISKSGGMTRRADNKHVYVVHADGNVVAAKGSLFSRNYDAAMQPGDTIVVPMDTERLPRLPFWQAVTQIIYNLAVSVAAVNSF